MNDLAKHPAIVAFAEAVLEDYDLLKDTTVDGGCATVHPMNPPYQRIRYLAPFVEHLEQKLEACGFKCVNRDRYKFEGHGLTAYIENVDVSDPEYSDPIQVDFFEP